MHTVSLYTLGCKLNFSETSTLRRQFEQNGFSPVEFQEGADVYLINTCSVTDHADKKCRKVVREALKANPKAYIVVVGCYAQLKPREIAEIPGVDLVLGANEKFRLFEHVSEFVKNAGGKIIAGDIREVSSFHDAYSAGDRTRSFLKIQDGCDYKCSFCTIPLARGKSRSDTLENILRNAKSLGNSGVKELVLTGVNIGDYGKDQPHTFYDVVRALEDVGEVERFRISSCEPNLLSEDIIRFVAKSARFMPHFHIPLQSGNDEMLAAMRRRYRRQLYADRVAQIRAHIPHACIGVDVITGFPGETKALFDDTFQFLQSLDVSYFHVFTYSERANTLAAEMQNKVPQKEREVRTTALRALSEQKKLNFYSRFLQQVRPVLFEAETQGDQMFGFTDNYIKVSAPYDPLLVNEVRLCTLAAISGEGIMQVETDTIPETLHT